MKMPSLNTLTKPAQNPSTGRRKHPDSFVGEGTHKVGALYDMIAPAQSVVKPAGEWNLCIIEVDHNANKGMVSLNGTIIVEFPVQGAEWDALVENSKFQGWKGFGIYPTGHLALQDHGNQVWFRDIKIKRCPTKGPLCLGLLAHLIPQSRQFCWDCPKIVPLCLITQHYDSVHDRIR